MTDKEFINSVDKMTTEKLFEELENIGCDGYYRDIWSAIVGELKHRIEKADQEPKTGHWIWNNSLFDSWTCSECGLENDKETDYCPNCGCRMESEG